MPIPELRGAAVLVTGGAGFIGSHLAARLVELGARVRVLDDLSSGSRENLSGLGGAIELLQGDLRDAGACRQACDGVRFVFHQAARGSVPRSLADPATTVDVNVTGTARLFAAARDAGVERVVYASSSSVYGDSDRMPRKEGQEGRPLSPYALSKRMNEELAETFGRCFGMELVGLRYFNIFGPRQNPQGPYAAVVPRFFAAFLAGEAPVIFGDGSQSRDFTFVEDAVRANLLAAGAPREAMGRAYNVGAGGTTTVLELARVIRELCGGGPKGGLEPRHEPVRAGDVLLSLADLADAGAGLGYSSSVDLADGLAATAPWYRSRPV